MLRKNSSDSRTGIIALLQYIIKVDAIIIKFFSNKHFFDDFYMNSHNSKRIFLKKSISKRIFALETRFIFKEHF